MNQDIAHTSIWIVAKGKESWFGLDFSPSWY